MITIKKAKLLHLNKRVRIVSKKIELAYQKRFSKLRILNGSNRYSLDASDHYVNTGL